MAIRIAADPLMVSQPLVREAPPGMMMTAGFAEWTNQSGSDIEVTGASSPAYKRVEIHLSITENGVARMEKQKSLVVPANGKVVLKPGGLHLMLMGANGPVKVGDKVEITLHTSEGDQTVVFDVKRF